LIYKGEEMELTKDEIKHRREVLSTIMEKKITDKINEEKSKIKKSKGSSGTSGIVDPMNIEDDFSFRVIMN